MPKLSPVNAKELIKILQKQGFVTVHQKGSHVRLKHADSRRTSVPVHAGEKVGVGFICEDTKVLIYPITLPISYFIERNALINIENSKFLSY